MTYVDCIEKIGYFIHQCFERNGGQLECDWCPAQAFCCNDLGHLTCHDVMGAWAKEETGNE